MRRASFAALIEAKRGRRQPTPLGLATGGARPLAAAHTPLDIGCVLGSKPPIAPGEAEGRATARRSFCRESLRN